MLAAELSLQFSQGSTATNCRWGGSLHCCIQHVISGILRWKNVI